MKRIEHILLAVFFVTLTSIFFYQIVLRGNLPVPSDALVGLYHPWRDVFAGQYPRGVPFKNFLITDPVRQQIPWRKLVIDSWKSGHMPLWNPYTFAGVPLSANIQAAPFYPFNILFFLFSFPSAWTVLIIIQPLLSGIFLYWYLRNQKLSSGACVIGAITWAFGGFSISWMTWGTITQTAMWAPLMLLALDRIRGRRWIVVLALSIVMLVTAGHAQIALYMLVVAGCYAIWRKSSWSRIRIGLAAALILTSVQWVPLLRFLLQAGRIGAIDNWKVAGWFLPWQNIAQFIAPDFFGNPATMNYWGVWNYGEFIGYIGIIPLVFALSALFLSGVPMFFSVALVLSLLFMLPTPFAILPFVFHIPLLSVLQPTRLMVVVDLSLAVLSAYGFENLKTHPKRFIRSYWIVGLGVIVLWIVAFGFRLSVSQHNLILPTALLAAGIIWYAWRRILWYGIIILIVFDLFRFGWKFTPFTPARYFFPSSYVLTFLNTLHKPFRIMSTDDRILPPNTSLFYGIESIEGYDPIAPERYERFLAASELGVADFSRKTGFNRIYTAHTIDSVLLPYLNVKYILTLSDVKRPDMKKVLQDGAVRVYEYTRAFPRVYLADTIRVEKSPEDALRVLISMSPTFIGIVEKPIAVLSVPILAGEGVRIVQYSTNGLSLRTTTMNSRLVVILNSYDGNWHAAVDGISTPVMRVNYLFTGLIVPAGTHEVTLIYR